MLQFIAKVENWLINEPKCPLSHSGSVLIEFLRQAARIVFVYQVQISLDKCNSMMLSKL